MNLDDLALKYDTDKSSKSHWYTHYYEDIFGSIRESVESMLEIGVGGGASIRMWMDYFPNALIYGVDQNKVTGAFGGRVTLFECEQTDETLVNIFKNEKLEIIVDDCSHDQDKTVQTLNLLFPLLQPKGWYVIEDMDRGMTKIGQWISEHREVERYHVFSDKGQGSHIYFIRK
jgi:trans-aconitate methyltransferase